MPDRKISQDPSLPSGALEAGDLIAVVRNGVNYSLDGSLINATPSANINASDTIVSFATVTTLTIAGDVTDKYKAGDSIEIVGSTSNDGTYAVSIDSTESGGFTTITTSGSWTVEVAAGSVTGETIDLNDANGVTGTFTVQADADFTASRMLNPPSVEFRMYSDNGLTVTYSPVTVGSAVLGDIVLETLSNLSVVGRSEISQSDFLELSASSTYIRQINASTLA